MEVLLPLAAGLVAFSAAWLATCVGGGASLGRASSRVRRMLRRAIRTLTDMGDSPLVRAVAGAGPISRLVAELVGRPLVRALGLDERSLSSALVLGVLLEAALGSMLLGSAALGLATAVITVSTVVARDASRRQRDKREIAAAMPGVYRTLAVALGSGQTLAQAIAYVGSHERGPAAGIFARMSLRLRCGMGTEEAVALLASELGAPGTDLLAAALVISHRTGSPLRDLLNRSARLSERQGEFQRLLAVKTAQVRLSVRIVCLLPVVMIAVLVLISPDFQGGLLTPTGMGCVAAAMGLDGVALLVIRRLVRGVL